MIEVLLLVLVVVTLVALVWISVPHTGVWTLPLVWLAAALLSTTFYALLTGFAQSKSWQLWLVAAALLCSPLALAATLRAPRKAPIWLTLPVAALGALTLPFAGLGALFLACSGGPGICPS